MGLDDAGALSDEYQAMPGPATLGRGFTRVAVQPLPAAGAAFLKVFTNDYWHRVVALTFTYTASASAGDRYPFINYLDASGNLIYQVPAAPVVPAGVAALISADLGQTNAFAAAVSQTITGNATAVTASQVIATMSLPAGTWVINSEVIFSGTTGAAEVDNLALNVAGVQVYAFLNGNSAGQQYNQQAQEVTIPAGGATVTITAIANGTATARYNVAMTATLQGSATYNPRLPDLVMQSAWQIQISATGILSGDQISAPVITSEHYSSSWASGAVTTDRERDIAWLRRQLLGG